LPEDQYIDQTVEAYENYTQITSTFVEFFLTETCAYDTYGAILAITPVTIEPEDTGEVMYRLEIPVVSQDSSKYVEVCEYFASDYWSTKGMSTSFN